MINHKKLTKVSKSIGSKQQNKENSLDLRHPLEPIRDNSINNKEALAFKSKSQNKDNHINSIEKQPLSIKQSIKNTLELLKLEQTSQSQIQQRLRKYLEAYLLIIENKDGSLKYPQNRIQDKQIQDKRISDKQKSCYLGKINKTIQNQPKNIEKNSKTTLISKKQEDVNPLTKSFIFRVKKNKLQKINHQKLQQKIKDCKENQIKDQQLLSKIQQNNPQIQNQNQVKQEQTQPEIAISHAQKKAQDKIKTITSQQIINKLKKRIKSHLKIIQQLNKKIQQLEIKLKDIHQKKADQDNQKIQTQIQSATLQKDVKSTNDLENEVQFRKQETNSDNLSDFDIKILREQLLERQNQIQSLWLHLESISKSY